MIEEMEDEKGRELIERFRELVESHEDVSEMLEDKEILTTLLQIRFLVLSKLAEEWEGVDIVEGIERIGEGFKDHPQLIDMFPYVENYLVPIVKSSSKLIRTVLNESPEEFKSFDFKSITYPDFMRSMFSHPVWAIILIYRPEIAESLKDSINLSLKVEVLLFVFMFWMENKISIKENVLMEAKDTFKSLVQHYFIAFRRFLKFVEGDKRAEFSWEWAGVIKDNRSAVEVQHEIFRWRVESCPLDVHPGL